ncbi:hypothetical protein BJ508DRAFT_333709 [Ascobolus immersus RN42]|uniref:DUF6603 domain-containing protein n=1 Tax=Ascobolus immersus RN42 TaxID=1160509 RepID=A0A3N4HIW4_ASCIM|nr:hypothetical protein BJ508DRAFT_333709 [Ascobolus immersus RN42]
MSYTIYHSKSGQTPNPPANGLLDVFIGRLTEGRLVLTAQPGSDTSGKVEVSGEDSMRQWFQLIDTEDAMVSVDCSLTGAELTLKNFEITLRKMGATFVFNSSKEILDLALGSQASRFMDSSGFMLESKMQKPSCRLIAGLDVSNSNFPEKGFTLKQLFELAGLERHGSYVPSHLNTISANISARTGTEAKRNALWFDPANAYRTDIRLSFEVVGSGIQTMGDFLAKHLPGVQVDDVEASIHRSVGSARSGGKQIGVELGRVAFRMNCSITPKRRENNDYSSLPPIKVSTVLMFLPGALRVSFLFQSAGALDGIIKWLEEQINTSLGFTSWMSAKMEVQNGEGNGSSSFFSDAGIHLHRMTLEINHTKGSEGIQSISLDLQVDANFGTSSDENQIYFFMTFSWSKDPEIESYISGDLWTGFDKFGSGIALPSYEKSDDLKPFVAKGKKPQQDIDLSRLIPGIEINDYPAGIPKKITHLYARIGTRSIRFSTSLRAEKVQPDPTSKFPQLSLEEVDLSLAVYFYPNQPSRPELNLYVSVPLTPAPTSKHPDVAYIRGQIAYENSTWLLHGEISGLYCSCLYPFFGIEDKAGMSDVQPAAHASALIDSLEVEYLGITYTYAKARGSVFSISGIVSAGGLQLKIDFDWKTNDWTFEARLNAKEDGVTLGKILQGLTGTDSGGLDLPEFITEMPFAAGSKHDDTFSFKIEQKDGALYLNATLSISSVALTFAQYRDTKWTKDVSSKRFIKAAIDALPQVKLDLPLVGEVNQPFDEIYFMWIQDSGKAAGVVSGLTKDEAESINKKYTDLLMWKKDSQPPNPNDAKAQSKAGSEVVLPAGSHFVVIVKDLDKERVVLLDYHFMKPKPDSAPNSRRRLESGSTTDSAEVTEILEENENAEASDSKEDEKSDSPSDESDATKATAPLKRKTGALSVKNIGFKYANKKLEVSLDATFELGPLDFSLLGLSIKLPITSLSDIGPPEFHLEGLAASYEKPPLTIAGIIRHGTTGSVEYYAGGLIVGFQPWMFEAAGFYGTVVTDVPGMPKSTYNPIFVFARLQGPLVDMGYATISGVTGGFGYRTDIRLPSLNEITEFPFISAPDVPPKPGGKSGVLAKLESLINVDPKKAWFTPNQPGKPETFWGAAGMQITAFKMLSLNAVVVAQFAGESLKLGLYAVGVADIPSTESKVKLAHIELGLMSMIDMDYGVLKVEAQLSPKSYIFHPDCKLTGGFALCYWFEGRYADSSRVGDWVFTIGGYHQAFKVPDGYPRPERLAISWKYSDAISIRGEAYFAITPKVCMGGGRLRATLSAGPLEAFFDVFADFLINYQPFHFIAEVGIAVGVKYNIDFLFIHTHIDVELHASLTLWGPPLAGVVHVNFWIVSFDIDFGQKNYTSTNGISLWDFYCMAVQKRKDPQLTVPSRNEAHTISCISGLLNTEADKAQSKEDDEWTVRGGSFVFQVSCSVAAQEVKFGPVSRESPPKPIVPSQNVFDEKDNDWREVLPLRPPSKPIKDVHAKPMKLPTALPGSKLMVTIEQGGKNIQGLEKWTPDLYTKAMPSGIWGEYSSETDPAYKGNHINSLLQPTDATVNLRMGMLVAAPPPFTPNEPLGKIKFNNEKENVQEIESGTFKGISNAIDSWGPEIPIRKPDGERKPNNPTEQPEETTERDVPEKGDDSSAYRKPHRDDWEAALNAWEKPQCGADQGQDEFVKAWANLFKWDLTDPKEDEKQPEEPVDEKNGNVTEKPDGGKEKPVPPKPKKMSRQLNARIPERLAANFFDTFVAAPLVSCK